MASTDRITSTKNPLVRRFRAAAEGMEPGLVVAEGFRLAEEALAAGLVPVEFAWSRRRPAGTAAPHAGDGAPL
jgi:hypothetical protein